MDKFKGCLSAPEAARLVAEEFSQVLPDWTCYPLPIADGGEGTVEALVAATGGQRVAVPVTGPHGQQVAGYFGIDGTGQLAIIEVAAACGFALAGKAGPDFGPDADPDLGGNAMSATSFGAGELIRAALDLGLRRFVIGLGGTLTTDAGAGLAQALGAGLLDAAGVPIGLGGQGLGRLAQIDLAGLDPRLADCVFDVACDVDHVLAGPQGAAQVFAPQKGATPEMVARLDANLGHFATIVEAQLGVDVRCLAGGGAAGGMGAGLVAMLGARLGSGAQLVAAALDLEGRMADADLVITGEGRMDGQSIHGKAPVAVAMLAQRLGLPVIVLAGALEQGCELAYDHGVTAMFGAVARSCTVEEAMAQAQGNVRAAARNLALALKIGGDLARGRVKPA